MVKLTLAQLFVASENQGELPCYETCTNTSMFGGDIQMCTLHFYSSLMLSTSTDVNGVIAKYC